MGFRQILITLLAMAGWVAVSIGGACAWGETVGAGEGMVSPAEQPVKVAWVVLAVFAGCMLLWGVGLLPGLFLSKHHLAMRLILVAAAWLCQALAWFCVFGFCASFEPGVGLGWKIGYAGAVLLLLAAAGMFSLKLIHGTHGT